MGLMGVMGIMVLHLGEECSLFLVVHLICVVGCSQGVEGANAAEGHLLPKSNIDLGSGRS